MSQEEKLSGKPRFDFLLGAPEITVAVQTLANTACCGGAGRSREARGPALPPAPQGPGKQDKRATLALGHRGAALARTLLLETL